MINIYLQLLRKVSNFSNFMTLNNAKNIKEIYTLIKKFYTLHKYDNKVYSIKQTDINDKRFSIMKKVLQETNVLDFSFTIKFYDECNFYYHIHNNNDNYYIIKKYKLNQSETLHLFRIITRISILKHMYYITKPMNYFLLMYPGKRFMPDKNKLISVYNINGGFTHINNNNIFIIRSEEYEKVLIHELLHHSIQLQFEGWTKHSISKIKNAFNIAPKCIILPTEAIIEAYACLINTIFNSIENKKNFTSLLKKDRDHSLRTAKKIIDYQQNNLWYEKTNAFCYTVLKTIIYIYFDQFLKIFLMADDKIITDFFIKYSKYMYKRLMVIKSNDNYLKLTAF